jgi:hypothetical protein
VESHPERAPLGLLTSRPKGARSGKVRRGFFQNVFILELWRISLTAHWTPSDSSMLAILVSMIPGEVHSALSPSEVQTSCEKS